MLNIMTTEQLAKVVMNKEELFILDVRNQSDFRDWKIEGENIEILNIPYFDLIDSIDQAITQIPENKKLLVVCAKEGSSLFVAEQIAETGRENVLYLQGGMKAWSEHLEQVKVFEDDQLKVFQFIRVGKGCLSYMVVSGKEAFVVDPSRFTDVYQQVAHREGVMIKHVVDSHLHADHISGGKELSAVTGASYYLMRSEGAVFNFEALEDHEHIQFEQAILQVLAVKTPGHTPGSVSFLVNDKLLFSGDTIFVGGMGRPDLGGKAREWAADLYETVYSKVSKMTDDVIVLPSHYADLDDELNAEGYIGASLGDIRKSNELMQNKDKHDFIATVSASANSDTPPNFEEIVAINRGMEAASMDRQQELEIGPNRCAVHHNHSA